MGKVTLRKNYFNNFTCCTQIITQNVAIRGKVALIFTQDKYILGKITLSKATKGKIKNVAPLEVDPHKFVFNISYQSMQLNH